MVSDHSHLIDEKNILFKESSTREGILEELATALEESGKLTSKEEFLREVFVRESVSPTGLEKGLAIPHGKSSAVTSPTIAIARLNEPITNWPSIDEHNQVDLIFLLAIPEENKGDLHLQILGKLSALFMREGFIENLKNASTEKEIVTLLEQELEGSQKTTTLDQKQKTVLVMTACSTGIAHTYMSAEALEKAGEEMGINVFSEKHGAGGVEDQFSQSMIDQADAIIIAADVAIKGLERFNGKPYIKSRVARPLKESKEMLTEALSSTQLIQENSEENAMQNEKKTVKEEIMQAVLTGISYMIPVIVAGGVLLGLPALLALPFGNVDIFGAPEYFALHPQPIFKYLSDMGAFGWYTYQFMYPVFAAYISYSIAGRSGLMAGFVGGSVAGGLTNFILDTKVTSSGFLGAIFFGVVVGYLCRFLNENLKFSKDLRALKTMLVIPVTSLITVFILNIAIVQPVISKFVEFLTNLLAKSAGTGQLIYAAIISGGMAFDLGGPVNKTTETIALGLAADKIMPLTAHNLGIVIAPVGLGIACIIDARMNKGLFDDELRTNGRSSILLGCLAISEGAIPFALKNPLIVIPINVIGTILGATVAVGLGAEMWLPLSAVWGWPLINKGIPAYVIGFVVGVSFIAIANIVVRLALRKRKEQKV